MKAKPSDEYWMSLAIQEALKGQGHTSPNPIVGAVLVKNQKQIATGFHRKAGLPHAEIEAFRKVKSAKGSTLYVTLEPCCHNDKRTPPCTETILRSGVRRVVIGTLDSNPKVSGRAVSILRRAGIETKVGVLQEDCRDLNIFYNHWIVHQIPWIQLKVAASLDGRVALANGESRWISGELSRNLVHQWRREVDGVMVGVGTVLADDPQLTSRISKTSRQPIRIILDPHFKIPERAKVLAKSHSTPCWVVVSTSKSNSAKAKRIEKNGGEVIACPLLKNGSFDLPKLLKLLGQRGLISVMVEGGPKTWTAFLEQNCANELWVFQAPKLLGADAVPMFGSFQLKNLQKAKTLSLRHFEILGEDVLLGYRFESKRVLSPPSMGGD